MLLGTFQGIDELAPERLSKRIENIEKIPESKRNVIERMCINTVHDKRTGTKEFGFSPVWFFPMPTLADAFAKASVTSMFCPLVFFAYDIPENELIKLDAQRHENRKYESLIDLRTSSNDIALLEYIIDSEKLNYYEPKCIAYTAMTRMKFPYGNIRNTWPESINNAYQDLNKELFEYFDKVREKKTDYAFSLVPTKNNVDFRGFTILKDEFIFTYLPFIFETLDKKENDTFHTAKLAAISRNMQKYVQLKAKFGEKSETNKLEYNDYKSIYDDFKSMVCENINVLAHLINTGEPKRNDLCPCGSGKKWKICHGRLHHKVFISD